MSVENVKMFYEAISKDEALKQKFVELSHKYQGQPMDEEKAIALTEQEVLPVAEKLGYSFTMDDLKNYIKEMKQADMSRELSDEELQAVAGGGRGGQLLCPYIGVPTNNATGFCLIVGVGSVENVRTICVFVGVNYSH